MAAIPPYRMLSEGHPLAREANTIRMLELCFGLNRTTWISRVRVWMGKTAHLNSSGPHKALQDFDSDVFGCVHLLAGYAGGNSWNGGQVADENLQRTIAFFPFLHTHPFLAELSKLNTLTDSHGIFSRTSLLLKGLYPISADNKRMAMNICWSYLSLVKQHFIHIDKKTANLMRKKHRERTERLESFVKAYFNAHVRSPICSFVYRPGQNTSSGYGSPPLSYAFDNKGLEKLQADFQTMWTAFKEAVRRLNEKAKIRFVRNYSLTNPGEGVFRGLFFIEGCTDVPGEFLNTLRAVAVTDEAGSATLRLMNAADCDAHITDPESYIKEQNKKIRMNFKSALPGLMNFLGSKLELDEALVLHVDQQNELFKKAGGNGKTLFSSSWSATGQETSSEGIR